MKSTLSVILPVGNYQLQLRPLVESVLEVLSDAAIGFELLVVVNGATDATIEVSEELMACYPQVRRIFDARRLTSSCALRLGLTRTTGDIVLFRCENSTFELRDLVRMWHEMPHCDVAVARSAAAAPLGFLPRLPRSQYTGGWTGVLPSLIMLHRHVGRAWLAEIERGDLFTFALNRRYECRDVELRERQPVMPLLLPSQIGQREPAPIVVPQSVAARRGNERTDQGQRGPVARPSYLARLRQFAWGE